MEFVNIVSDTGRGPIIPAYVVALGATKAHIISIHVSLQVLYGSDA